MLLFNIRCLLCRLFSWHETEMSYERPNSPWDIVQCKWCGMYAERHWHDRTIRFLDYRDRSR